MESNFLENLQLGGQEEMLPEAMEEESLEGLVQPNQTFYEPSHFPLFNHENLAEFLSETELAQISADLIEGIKDDVESRSALDEMIANNMKLLGMQKLEDINSMRKTGVKKPEVYDSTMLNCLLDTFLTVRNELYPSGGFASFYTLGDADEAIEKSSEKQVLFVNTHYTNVDTTYLDESDKKIFSMSFTGDGVAKWDISHETGWPFKRFIEYSNFIVNTNFYDLSKAPRFTEVVTLTKQDVETNNKSGYFVNCELNKGLSYSASSSQIMEKNLVDIAIKNIDGTEMDREYYRSVNVYRFFEVYAFTDYDFMEKFKDPLFTEMHKNKDDFISFPEDSYFKGKGAVYSGNYAVDHEDSQADERLVSAPYVYTICDQTQKIVNIRRDWKFTEPFKRKGRYIRGKMLPGFGAYPLGIGHLMSGAANAATEIKQEVLTSLHFSNAPVLLTTAGISMPNPDKEGGAGSIIPVETGGLPLREAITDWPFHAPSPLSLNVLESIKNDMKSMNGSDLQKMAEQSGNTTTATTLALVQRQNRFHSAILASFVNDLREELKLLQSLLKEVFENNPDFLIQAKGKSVRIGLNDFYDSIVLTPACDPTVSSVTEKMVKVDTITKLAQGPGSSIFNQQEVYRLALKTIDVEEEIINKLIPPAQEAIPLDPVTENANAIVGKALKADMAQDHLSHYTVHMELAMNPNTPEEAKQILMAHAKEHFAFQYLIDMQSQIGQIPVGEPTTDIELQNQIALAAAQVSQEQIAQQQAQDPQNAIAQVGMAEVEQKREAAKERSETEKYKADMSFEKEKLKSDTQKELQDKKAELQITLEEIKHEGE